MVKLIASGPREDTRATIYAAADGIRVTGKKVGIIRGPVESTDIMIGHLDVVIVDESRD